MDARVGHDLGVALRGRRKDQHAGAVLGLVQAMGEELPHRRRVRAPVLGAARHDAEAYRRQHEHQRRDDEGSELDEVDDHGRPEREMDQRRRHEQRQRRGPRQGHDAIIARLVHDHAENLARGLRLRRADGVGDARPIGLRDHGLCPHQLPDEPPPPNEPPPPENPPPSKPPPHPPDEPEDHDEPDGPIHELPRERRPRSRGMAPTSVRNTSPNTKMTSSTTSNEPQFTAPSGRLAARCCHSAASPVSTLTMSSTPRLMPPGKSLARKRGMIAFSMMSRETASVSVPSSP